MGAQVYIEASEDDLSYEISGSYSAYGEFCEYMELHGINPIKKMRNNHFDEDIYRREDLERLIQIAKNENKYEEIWRLKTIEAILGESKSKTFTIRDWG